MPEPEPMPEPMPEPTPEPEPEPMPDPIVDEWPDWPVPDRGTAQSISGGTPLTLTVEEIRNRLSERIESVTHSAFEHEGGGSICLDDPNALIGGPNCDGEFEALLVYRDVPLFQTRTLTRDSVGEIERKSANLLGVLEYGIFVVGSWIDVDQDHLKFGRPEKFGKEFFGQRFAYEGGLHNLLDPVPSGHWAGAMVGMDQTDTASRGDVVLGDADIRVEFHEDYLFGSIDASEIDVKFTNIRDLKTGGTRPDIVYEFSGFDASIVSSFNNVPFRSEFGINGNFVGPNHEEVVGTFETEELVGAFGAKRQ